MLMTSFIRPVLAGLLILAAAGCAAPPDTGETVDIARALSSDNGDDCYEKAVRPGVIRFPKDYGSHDTFKTEWWYYTGNLKTDRGRHFGFQLTFFRQSLDCKTAEGNSDWRTNQLYFAHFAVTDTLNRRFFSAQRMNRGSLGLAGARSAPFRVWIDDWQASGTGVELPGPIQVVARAVSERIPGNPGFAIRLTLDRVKPTILQGDRGLSRKGPDPYDASHYYSFPGMAAQGTVTVAGAALDVQGHAWFDHEWSTSALGPDVAGWDWFSLRINTGPRAGTDLMVCLVRRTDGTPNGFGFGAISRPDGSYAILEETDFSVISNRTWTSPDTGRTYPAGWTVVLEEEAIEMAVDPVMDGQEHSGMFPYYEGAVRVSLSDGDGLGYVEMTGY